MRVAAGDNKRFGHGVCQCKDTTIRSAASEAAKRDKRVLHLVSKMAELAFGNCPDQYEWSDGMPEVEQPRIHREDEQGLLECFDSLHLKLKNMAQAAMKD